MSLRGRLLALSIATTLLGSLALARPAIADDEPPAGCAQPWCASTCEVESALCLYGNGSGCCAGTRSCPTFQLQCVAPMVKNDCGGYNGPC